MGNVDFIALTQTYLEENFSDCNIVKVDRVDAAEDLCFEVRSSKTRYFLRIQKEVLDDQENGESYETLLHNYQVATTMKGLGDFPVVVTLYGCIFGSP